MPMLSYIHHLFNANSCHVYIHTLRWKDPHSPEFLRNNCLRVGAPLPLRLCLCFATQGHPMTDEAVMRCSPSNYAARSIVTV